MTGISTIGLVHAFGRAQSLLATSAQRLATGQRINAGRDDPAGLIASENLESQLAALEAESRASERNDAVARTADAALGEVGDMLTEGQSLAVAAANTGAMSDAERDALQLQMDSVNQSVDRTLRSASFGGVPLFNGDVSIPAGGDSLHLDTMTLSSLGRTDFGGTTYDQSDTSNGEALAVNGDRPADTQTVLGASIEQIATLRGQIGAFQKNAIQARRAGIQSEIENVSAANSIIRDTDYAAETANFARQRTLAASTGAVLAIANQNPQNAAGLLGIAK
ncbi:MAG: flagellin [Phycisphaeraceae bacterium]|nr:MAG: flagellin [Phycisphaeraceae bacterium]